MLVQARDKAVDSIAEIDLNPYVLTEYEAGDYVLRRYLLVLTYVIW